MFYDKDGLIVHKGLDGGDTAQREGWYWLGVWIRQHVLSDPWPIERARTFPEVIHLLEPNKNGVFYRHPKLDPWNIPHDKKFGLSRDQMVPLVAAMGVWGEKDALLRLWNALPQDPVGGLKHTFNGDWVEVFGNRIYHTGDIVALSTINLFRRAWNEDPLKAGDGNGPAGDVELIANSALKVPPALTNPDNTGDDLNHIISLMLAILRFPSDISTQAVQIYAKNRLVSYGSYVTAYRSTYGQDLLEIDFTDEVKRRLDDGIASGWPTDAGRSYGAVRWYHRASTGANPELALLYEPIIRSFLE